MRRNVIDVDDAVGNGATFNGTGGNDRFVGRSAEATEAAVGPGQLGEEFSGSGGSDVFVGRGGNDSFFLNGGDDSFFQDGGNDRVVAAAEDGFQAQVFGFEAGAGDRIDFRNFDANSIDDLIIEEGNGGTLVSAEGSQVYNLRGIDIDDINADDFAFSGGRNNNVASIDDEEETSATPEEEEEVDATPEAEDSDSSLNVIDGSDFDPGRFFNAQELEGTGGDDLIIVADDAENRVNARGGDDTIQGFGGGVDIVDSGAGNDILVANNNGSIVLADISANNDVFDFSDVAGANSFDDIEITADADSDEDQLGATEVKAGDSTRFFVSEEVGDALDEDNFVFTDDDVAVA